MRRSFFFVCALFELFSACNITTKDDLSFDLHSFGQQTYSRNEAHVLAVDSLLLGRPLSIRFHPDNFIVIQDNGVKNQISIIDLEDQSTQGFIPKGRGPMELVTAWDIGLYNGDVWISGPQESKLIRLVIDQRTREFDAAAEFNLSETQFVRALPFNDSEFLIFSKPSSGKRMEIVSDSGHSIREVGSFPDIRVQAGWTPNNFWLQSNISLSPNRKHTVVSYRTIDYIEVYNRGMELVKRLRGPVGANPEFVVQKVAAGTRFIQNPSFFFYQASASTDDMFFVGYNGVEVKSREDFNTEMYRILSFDWSGKPLKCYTFDHPVWCFDVDADGKRIFIATQHPESLEPEILIYGL